MCKKTYVTLSKGKRLYKLFAPDIKNVHTSIRKKRPTLPKYESPTEMEV